MDFISLELNSVFSKTCPSGQISPALTADCFKLAKSSTRGQAQTRQRETIKDHQDHAKTKPNKKSPSKTKIGGSLWLDLVIRKKMNDGVNISGMTGMFTHNVPTMTAVVTDMRFIVNA